MIIAPLTRAEVPGGPGQHQPRGAAHGLNGPAGDQNGDIGCESAHEAADKEQGQAKNEQRPPSEAIR